MDESYLRVWIIIAMWTTKGGSTNDPEHITHLYAIYGDPVILKCLKNTNYTTWDGPSPTSYYGYHVIPYAGNDQVSQQLPNAKNFMVVGDISNGEYNLKIINLTQREEGYYKCYAQRGGSLSEVKYFLKIKETPKKLTTNGKNGILVGHDGAAMNITCNVKSGVPENETQMSLYFKEKIINKTFAEMLIYTFVPRKVNNGDTFKCVVENLLLESPLEETIRLKVLYRPSVRFDKNDYNNSVYEGTYFSITCFSDSNPITTEILWEANGTMIDKQIQPSKHLPLNIANIQQHHEGKYTCVAINGLGIGKKSIYITVLCCQEQKEKETTNATVLVVISVISVVTIFLGIIIFLAKDKLKKRETQEAIFINTELDYDNRDDLAVDNQMYQSRDDIADNETTVQRQVGAYVPDDRLELSGGRTSHGCVNAQANNALNYAEISFTPGTTESRFVVHGKDTITIYSDVVLPVASVAVHLDE